jgi:hypothetical protein
MSVRVAILRSKISARGWCGTRVSSSVYAREDLTQSAPPLVTAKRSGKAVAVRAPCSPPFGHTTKFQLTVQIYFPAMALRNSRLHIQEDASPRFVRGPGFLDAIRKGFAGTPLARAGLEPAEYAPGRQ